MSETYHLSQMGGIWRLGLVLAAMAIGFVVAVGCSKTANTETIAVTPSSEETAARPSRPSRSEIACHLHSCAPPYYCNRDKGVCEQLPCAQSRDCPYGYQCDFSKNVCE